MSTTYTDFHWFSFTLFFDENNPLTKNDINAITKEYFGIGLDTFSLVSRLRYGYSRFYTLQNTINIYVDGRADSNRNTVHFEITGMACDTLPDLDYIKLINYIESVNGKICRIDLYVNDCSHILDFETIKQLSYRDNYRNRIISTSRNVPVINISNSDSIAYGTRQSATRIVIYDKGMRENVDFPWLKVEVTLRDPNDIAGVCRDLNAGVPLPDITKGVLYRNLDFKVDGPQPKARRATESWWTEFLAGIDKRPSDRPKLEKDHSRDFDNLAKYVDKFITLHGNKGALHLERLSRQYPAQLSF